jgi:GH24 family phage-related lysozyme (muramidase)
MANAFDDLLGGLVNRLKGVGIGSRTAAQNRAEIDYMTPSNRAAQAGQATRGGPTEYYDLARRTDYNYKAPEYSQTMPLNRGMFSGSGLGLAAPADTYSAAPQSSVDRPSLGRGMYGMGTTPPEGPVDASVINPVFSGSDMDAIMAAGGRPTDSSSVFTTTDAETGKEVIVDAYGNAFFVPPASKTRPGFENETGNLNIPGMFDYAFGSDGRGAILDDATALTTGVSYARDVEGNPASFIADGIGGMFSAMDARANPGVTDQAVRRETATTKRNLEEERITIAQQLQEEKGYTRAQMASPFVQRQIEERLNKIVQEREIEQTDSDNLGVKQEVLDLADLDFGKEGSTIELDPSIVTVGDKPTNAEIVKTLNEDYANLAASGADSATLSELAREIDSYRDKEVSLPSIVSEAAASDVIESSRAEVVDTPDRFTTYIERVEGFKTGEGKTPFRYTSPEGGLDTIGLGHKLTQKEVDSNSVYGFDLDTLTKEQAKEIFKKDLPKYEKMLKSDLKTNYKKYKMKQPINYDTLNRKQQEMFLDFTFNLGSLRSFPKFTEAVLKGDMATARKEYKRTFTNDKGVTKEVKDRNEQFYNTYLK